MGEFHKVLVVVLSVWMSVTCPLVFSADSTAPPTTVGSSDFLPPSNSAAGNLQMANLFTNCMNVAPLLNQLGDMFKEGGACMPPINNVCVGDDEPPRIVTECTKFRTSGGGFDETLFNKQKELLRQASCTASCKKASLASLKTELTCLSEQGRSLEQQISMLQDAYTKNIQRMQQDVGKLQALEADRKAQWGDINMKLTGSKDGSGARGLLALQKDTKDLVGKMTTDIYGPYNPAGGGGIKETQVEILRQKKALEEQVQIRTVALAGECFSTRTKTQYRCEPDGPPVTAKQYVLCRYRQNQFIGKNGKIEQGANFEAQANAGTSGLSTLLEQILGDAPKDSRIGRNMEEAVALSSQSVRVLSMADLESQYGSKLASFNGKGLDIRSFVTKAMGSCFQGASKQVDRERKLANSALGLQTSAIKTLEERNKATANRLLTDYAQQFADNMAGLTGQHLPLNVSACQNAAPHVQLNCLEDVKKNMEGLLAGTTPQSTVDIRIPGQDPKNNIQFRCQGLNGCITTMQNVSRNLQQEVQKVGQFKKDYVMRANQSIQGYTKKMAEMLSVQSQALASRKNTLNSTLASLGAREMIDIKGVEGEQFEPDEGMDGLYKMPKSVLQLIGGQMTPPMLDVHGSSFSDGLRGLADVAKDLDRNQSEIKEAQAQLDGMDCKKEPIAKKLTAFQEKVALYNSGGCAYVSHRCSDSSVLGRLKQDFDRVKDTEGVDGDIAEDIDGKLSSGIGSCEEVSRMTETAYDKAINKTRIDLGNCSGITTALEKGFKDVQDVLRQGSSAGRAK